jgi:LAO/AO transport system kinase
MALADIKAALRYLPRKRASWLPRAVAISGLTGTGLEDLWSIVEQHRAVLSSTGELAVLRSEQQRAWMWSLIVDRLERSFRAHPGVAARLAGVEADVIAGRTTPTAAAESLLAELGRGGRE